MSFMGLSLEFDKYWLVGRVGISAYHVASRFPSLLMSFFLMLKLSYAKAIQELCFEDPLTSCLALWYCGLTVLFAFILQYAC